MIFKSFKFGDMVAETRQSRISADEFSELASQGVPFVGQMGCVIETIGFGTCEVRLPYQDLLLRPGGTVCGPAMMALADITLYGVVLSMIGRVELAVTADLNMHFLRKPAPGDLVARGRTLKLGRSLVVGDVTILAVATGNAVAHGVGTYALPASG